MHENVQFSPKINLMIWPYYADNFQHREERTAATPFWAANALSTLTLLRSGEQEQEHFLLLMSGTRTATCLLAKALDDQMIRRQLS